MCKICSVSTTHVHNSRDEKHIDKWMIYNYSGTKNVVTWHIALHKHTVSGSRDGLTMC